MSGEVVEIARGAPVASGIGGAIIRRLAHHGLRRVITPRRSEKPAALEIEARGGEARSARNAVFWAETGGCDWMPRPP